MFKLHLILIPLLSLTAGCLSADEASEGSDVDSTANELALGGGKYLKTFYVKNPYGKANRLRATASITSGSIKEIDIFNMNSPYWPIVKICGGTSCVNDAPLPGGCRDYGSVPVDVIYTKTGTATPSLKFWFTDCK